MVTSPKPMTGEFCVSTRFHANVGDEPQVERLVQSILPPVRAETACLGVEAMRSVDDPRLFIILSRWTGEEGHMHHRTLGHTMEFLSRIEPLLDEPPTSTRTSVIA
ncbi:MAG: putative quinol monooxygenase [Thermoplasmata archaeon]